MASPVLKSFASSISFHPCDIPITQHHDDSHFIVKGNKARSSYKCTLLEYLLNTELRHMNNNDTKLYLTICVTNRIETHLRNKSSFHHLISFGICSYYTNNFSYQSLKLRGLIYSKTKVGSLQKHLAFSSKMTCYD